MRKFALVSLFTILTAHLPALSPSKLVPADWLNSLEYGKKSIQLVFRLYQIQKNVPQSSPQQTADDVPCQATVCPLQSKGASATLS